ncbi:hypothetical protein VTL71DRAFT_4124 [Oculimacula yallundae]|uniref:Uncharacterized protein n=1 Tax=Oculimacula yallundae TaxID=86028 RepID=A0ABR4C6R6_9HELO
MHLPPSTTPIPLSSTHLHHDELPIPHPIYHSIGPKHRAETSAWIQEHTPDISGLFFVFIFLLILGGLWRLRGAVVEWFLERRREEARREWAERERRQRRTMVVVGILRRDTAGSVGEGEGDGGGGDIGEGERKAKVKEAKRVRFLDGLEEFSGVGERDESVLVVHEEGVEALQPLLDFLEDGRVIGEPF